MGDEVILVCKRCGMLITAFQFKGTPRPCPGNCGIRDPMVPLPSEVTVKSQGPGLIWTDTRSGLRFSELSLLLEERQRAEEAAERQAEADRP